MSQQYTIARYKVRGKKFEVLVDPDKALDYKLGRRKEFDGVLVFNLVYTDSKKGLKPSRKDLLEVFGTENAEEVAKKIVEQGELLIKTQQRERLIEDKKRQIVTYISKYCVDSRTNAPIPPLRIERAFDEIGVKIDPFKEVDEQIPGIIDELMKVIPLRKQISHLRVRIPAVYAGKVYGYVKGNCEVKREKWLQDGSYLAEVSIPSGLKTEFIDKLLNLTKGAAYVEVKEGTR